MKRVGGYHPADGVSLKMMSLLYGLLKLQAAVYQLLVVRLALLPLLLT